MQVTQVMNDGLTYQFKVTVPANDVDKAVEAKLASVAKQVKMPGFRPGKVPMNIVRDRYATSVRGEVVEKLVNDSTSKTLSDKGLRAAVQPKIELEGSILETDKDLEFTMAVEVLPTFTPADVTKLELVREKASVEDAAIDKRLTELAQRLPRSTPAGEGHVATMGDTLLVDFKGSQGGVERADMAATDFRLELGSDSLIPGFESQLVGIKAGESRTITVTFPVEYHAAELAGKEAQFTVDVKSVSVPGEAIVDEEFAKNLGAKDLASLKESVKSSLEAEYEAASRNKLKRAMMDKLADMHDFDVPLSMVEAEFGGIWQQVESDKARGTLEPEDQGKDDDTLKADYRKIAERRVRLGLLLAEIGTQQNVKLTNQDLQNAVRREAMRYPGQEAQVIEFYSKNPQAVQAVQASVFEEKVVDTIVDKAKVTDKNVTPEQLLAD